MKGWIAGSLTAAFFTVAPAMAADNIITMSTTTSTESSGLLDVLLPEFEKDSGIKVKVIAKGTGAALQDGMKGDVDVVFVHALEREEQFVEEGYGTKRYAVMHNDFVLIGPANDPAGVKGETNAAAAMGKIAASGREFISRGDDSGTHAKEQALWKEAGIPLAQSSQTIMLGGNEKTVKAVQPADAEKWYRSIGQGMGKTLTYADERQAYTLTDRGTYIKYKWGKTPPLDLEIVWEGGNSLANPYGVIPVNPEKHGHVKFDQARRFAEWLVSPRGQKVIADYSLLGKQLFFPDAIDTAKQ